jgi:ribonuclease P protein component
MRTTSAPRIADTPADWRLHRHADYQRVYKSSRKQFSARMSYFVAVQPAAGAVLPARVGITAGRVLGKAVERNRIKRRMRAAICAHFALLPVGLDIVLHPKRTVLDAPWAELSGEVQRIFTNIQKAARSRATQNHPTAGAADERAV